MNIQEIEYFFFLISNRRKSEGAEEQLHFSYCEKDGCLSYLLHMKAQYLGCCIFHRPEKADNNHVCVLHGCR